MGGYMLTIAGALSCGIAVGIAIGDNGRDKLWEKELVKLGYAQYNPKTAVFEIFKTRDAVCGIDWCIKERTN